jgi:hypothetical protein
MIKPFKDGFVVTYTHEPEFEPKTPNIEEVSGGAADDSYRGYVYITTFFSTSEEALKELGRELGYKL